MLKMFMEWLILILICMIIRYSKIASKTIDGVFQMKLDFVQKSLATQVHDDAPRPLSYIVE